MPNPRTWRGPWTNGFIWWIRVEPAPTCSSLWNRTFYKGSSEVQQNQYRNQSSLSLRSPAPSQGLFLWWSCEEPLWDSGSVFGNKREWSCVKVFMVITLTSNTMLLLWKSPESLSVVAEMSAYHLWTMLTIDIFIYCYCGGWFQLHTSSCCDCCGLLKCVERLRQHLRVVPYTTGTVWIQRHTLFLLKGLCALWSEDTSLTHTFRTAQLICPPLTREKAFWVCVCVKVCVCQSVCLCDVVGAC